MKKTLKALLGAVLAAGLLLAALPRVSAAMPAGAGSEEKDGIVIDAGHDTPTVELQEGKSDYTQDVESSRTSVKIARVPHRDGDTVALKAGGKDYRIGDDIPLEKDKTVVTITVTAADQSAVAYRLTIVRSLDKEIAGIDRGAAALGKKAVSLRVKPMVDALYRRYQALDEASKGKVKNAKALLNAVDAIKKLQKQADEAAAAASKTVGGINGEIAELSGRGVTLGDAGAVEKAMSAYDLLTTEQKAQVKNYAVLERAAKEIAALKAAARDGGGSSSPETGDASPAAGIAAAGMALLIAAAVARKRLGRGRKA